MTDTESWRVGVLFSQTGVTGAVERTQRAATLLAISEVNAAGGVLGRPIAPIAYEPSSTPSQYRLLAERLCDEDGVNVIFGGHMSNTRKAMLPVVEARDVLLFYPTLYEGFEYSRNCIYTGAGPNQNAIQLVEFLVREYGSRVLLVGSNYVYPYESNRIISDLFLSHGGQVLDELYVPLDLRNEHLDLMIGRIAAAQPDVVYSTIVGDGILPFYTAFKDAGFDAARMPIASQSTSEADIVRMRPDVAVGHVIAAPFFATLDTPQARRFVSAFRKANGDSTPPTAPAEAAYFQVHLYAAALARAGSDRIDDLLPALFDVEFEAPQGPVRIDRRTHHTSLWPRVARLREGGVYEIVSEPVSRVPPDPYMLAHRPVPLEAVVGLPAY